ncbi:pleckstrin homology domain-containing family G member 5 isoform X2 [Lutzomyia longipalpis]|uniref:pleckstrin homology domain-containing family G member 5 isoform X2 n=1 Tax=Lutzomyia longipalpis TaxID=7200 RepID=UPI002483D9C8|nr:pleckstrin homology domain-containing family G member 5 isoform X2 [Lutzomyia longipalpis]
MNKAKGSKASNRKVTKAPAGGGESEKKKPPPRKTKSTGKGGKKGGTEKNVPPPSETPPREPPIIPEGKKLERSNSFISRGLSKLYNTLAGSRDGINKTSSGESLESHDNVPEPPVFLRRSRTLGTISLRKNRSSIPTPLEDLTEEAEHRTREESPQGLASANDVPHGLGHGFGGSRESLGTSILTRLKRTFSITSDRRKNSMNSRWSASLQSLQQIDNMVSYEDLSFINYDEFNHIEKQVERALSQLDVKASASVVDAAPTPKPPEVVKRVKRREKKVSYKFQENWDANFDKDKNLYRQSLDTEKLQTFRKSFRWSSVYEPVPTEYLQLDTVQDTKGSPLSRGISVEADGKIITYLSHVRSLPNILNCNEMLQLQDLWTKSRSLTHLDSLESNSTNLDGNISDNSTPTDLQTRRPNFFTLVFRSSDKDFIPITDGVPLHVAIRPSLMKRNLHFSQVSINEDCSVVGDSPPYFKVLNNIDKDIPVKHLRGRTLIVTEHKIQKAAAHSLRKASSVGSRRPDDAEASFDDALSDVRNQSKSKSISNFHPLGSSSSLSSIKYVQQSGLIDILKEFMVQGIPNARSLYTCNHPNFQEALNYLGNPHISWRDFVKHDQLSDLQMHIQSRMWEIVTTEIKHIFALQTVTDHFLACLTALQERDMLPEINKKKLFSNIVEICEANLTFWATFVYPMVQHSVKTGEPLDMSILEPGFLSFADIFGPYKTYCSNQTSCLNYCRHLTRTNIFFAAYLHWCEGHEFCKRLKLADILVAPMQRLTKYKLILKTIRDDLGENKLIENLDEMILAVGDFVSGVDLCLSDMQALERLRGVMARIDGYDVVEKSGDTLDCMAKQYSSMFDLCDPIEGCAVETRRHLFMEGDLKFKDSTGKFDVHCFLLTDILLVCRINTKKTQGELKICRTPFLTDRLQIMLKDETVYCVYLNEFGLSSTAFSLQCSEAKSWYDAMEKARQLFTRLKHGYRPNIDGSRCTPNIKHSPKSAGSSQSGSMELNEVKTTQIDVERENSVSSEEGMLHGATGLKPKLLNLPKRSPSKAGSPILFEVKQTDDGRGQSMPDLYSSFISQTHSNTLLVPGMTTAHGSLLSTHRGISYPPPSPTRATLRRGLAFSFTNKNPPLVKTKNITSQTNLPSESTTSLVIQQQVSGKEQGSHQSHSRTSAATNDENQPPVQQSEIEVTDFESLYRRLNGITVHPQLKQILYI